MRQSRIALIIGTRPEAIKLSPVVHAFVAQGAHPLLYITGQHPGLELSDHGLADFDAVPLHCEGQPDPMLHAELVRAALSRAIPTRQVEMLVVQGHTSSALGGALAAREAALPLAHVEAGLRTHDILQPWPEESNRVAIDRASDLLFAPTDLNACNLRNEKVTGEIHVTGNSGIDALAALVGPLPRNQKRGWIPRRSVKLLVTCHRRENWGEGLDQLASALTELAGQTMVIDVVLPPNPTVTQRMVKLLGAHRFIRLVPPMSHPAMVDAMRRADILLSDSGGVQEEAPALGVPLLVLREKTERPEGMECGSMELVGTDPSRIVAAVMRLRSRSNRAMMARPALPFGDGHAAPRIAAHCLAWLADTAALARSA